MVARQLLKSVSLWLQTDWALLFSLDQSSDSRLEGSVLRYEIRDSGAHSVRQMRNHTFKTHLSQKLIATYQPPGVPSVRVW